ncbi:toll/interleukin-1 receptor domain-containing protein [Aureimonas sp. Leaf324]|uniref:toll/interleukin-1 receptor domain-containing protein n=1 Tax=Aureimonas sp. Leaf324 TaxID=1736336 RepID=UPI0006F1F98F|nr:toll/interleukin-1 receptor domain-containing protein [Aureimonas sp. Leaf324]KQQ78986.1 hypothetical protein ASF65_14010 [Aureimonas sp. Leaf324]
MFDAFVSYSHRRDRTFARALRKGLATLGKPLLRRHALRVFLDETSLSASPHLWGAVEAALDQSRYFILLASAEARASKWVAREIDYWLKAKGADTILLVVTDGEIAWDDTAHDFRFNDPGSPLPEELRGVFANEPRWVDLRAFRSAAADTLHRDDNFLGLIADLSAAIQGRAKDEILSDEIKAERRLKWIAGGTSATLAVFLGIAVWQAVAASDARGVAEVRRSEAEKQTRTAEEELLKGSAQEAALLTREGRPGRARDRLLEVLKLTKRNDVADLPASFYREMLTAMLENRDGPRLPFSASAKSRALPRSDYDTTDREIVVAFDPQAHVLAIARSYDVALWDVSTGAQLKRLTLNHIARSIAFNASGEALIVFGSPPRAQSKETELYESEPKNPPMLMTVIDPQTGVAKSRTLTLCREAIPCLTDGRADQAQLVDAARSVSARDLLAMSPDTSTAWFAPFGFDLESLQGPSDARFYLYSKNDKLVALDVKTQTLVERSSESITSGRSLASNGASFVSAGMLDGTIAFERIKIVNGRLAFGRDFKTAIAGSAGFNRIDFSHEGDRLLVSNYRWGTGGGNGNPLTALFDRTTKKLIWSTDYEGDRTVDSQFNKIAIYDDGLARVSDVATNQFEFAVEGYPLFFDPAGRRLLVLRGDEAGYTSAAADDLEFALVDATKFASIALDKRAARSQRGACSTGNPFRILSDRPQRLWNTYDWHRVRSPEGSEASAFTFSETVTQYFEWADGEFRIVTEEPDDEWKEPKPVSKIGIGDMRQRFPEFAAAFREEYGLIATKSQSPDGRWQGVVAMQSIFNDENTETNWLWFIFERTGASLTLRREGVVEGGPQRAEDISPIFFPLGEDHAVVPRSECEWALIDIASGAEQGRLTPGYAHNVAFAAIGDGLLAARSSDWYGSTTSVRLFDMAPLSPGPELVFTDREESDDDQNGRRPAGNDDKLVADSGLSSVGFSKDGRDLLVSYEYEDGRPAQTVAVGIPPWGARLRKIIAEFSLALPDVAGPQIVSSQP